MGLSENEVYPDPEKKLLREYDDEPVDLGVSYFQTNPEIFLSI